ncbi:MAG: MlaD family protein [Pseudomonadota bacterium]
MSEPEQVKQRIHYIHRMSYSTQERMVGAFVLGAVAILFVLLLANSKTLELFEETVTLQAYLKNAEGITTETTVKVSGIEVGRVERLDITPDNRIQISMRIKQRYRELIRQDSQAAIGKLSMFGRSTIDIEAGSPSLPTLPDGATIQVEEPLSMDQLIAELTPVVRAAESSVERFAAVMEAIDPKQVQSIVANLERSSADIRQVTGQIAEGRGSLGAVVYDEALEARLKGAVIALEGSLSQAEQRLAELAPVLDNVDTIARQTGEASHGFPALVEESQTMVGKVNTTLTSVNLEAKQIPELITRMNVLMEQTDRLLDGIANSWLFSDEADKERQKLIGVQPYHD